MHHTDYQFVTVTNSIVMNLCVCVCVIVYHHLRQIFRKNYWVPGYTLFKDLTHLAKLLSRKVKQIDMLNHLSHSNTPYYHDCLSFLPQSHGE